MNVIIDEEGQRRGPENSIYSILYLTDCLGTEVASELF
jgi:hypothetical protein